MTKEEIIQAISDDKMMPFIQPEQLAQIVEFVIKNYQPSLPSNLDEAAERYGTEKHPMSTIGANESAYDFKAGAKWMAVQGATCNGEIRMDFSDPDDFYARRLSADYWSELGPALIKVEPGDVLIQIRKKQ